MALYRSVARMKTVADFRDHLASLDVTIPVDDDIAAGPDSPLGAPYQYHDFSIGNRFCILPMEGWDGTKDGQPTEHTIRRWEHFGLSGAKLIWGGEAVAVRHDGRANPNQLLINDQTMSGLEQLRTTLIDAHQKQMGRTDDLYLGLQLTHSGRFARPNEKTKIEPKILYSHSVLNRKFNIPADYPVMTDDDIDRLVEDFIAAAKRSQKLGFQFIDVKHCHGYLGHEFLSAFDRPGKYGGSFENRTRYLRNIVAGVKAEAPGLHMGVRVSVFDWVPYRPGPDGIGEPEPYEGDRYRHAFGGDGTGRGIDLTEAFAFFDLLESLGITLVCVSVGSPYYNPHIQRPALFPPSDGYMPPEDPLVGVARQLAVTAELTKKRPKMAVVGSGYSYLQEYLPNVGQAVVRDGGAQFVGLGRMVLSYPEMPADILAGRTLARKKICRTFSDCTTAPRNGIISGCYPLDEYYKIMPEAKVVNSLHKK